jgi:hypothetical protein
MPLEILGILDVIDVIHFVVPVFVVAAVLWYFGVRQPFVLTSLSLILGLPVGWVIDRRWNRRKKSRVPPNST